MDDKLKEKLKNELTEMSEILLLAQESLKVVLLLIKEEENDDRAYVKKMNAFFVYTTNLYWRVIVIELCKLFSPKDTEQYNLKKFINKFKNSGFYNTASIRTESVALWEKLLQNEEANVANLILQRDKIYAHKDRNAHTVINNVALSKTEDLVRIVQKIIQEIYIEVYEISFLIDKPINAPVENLDKIIDILSQEKSRKENFWKELGAAHGIEEGS